METVQEGCLQISWNAVTSSSSSCFSPLFQVILASGSHFSRFSASSSDRRRVVINSKFHTSFSCYVRFEVLVAVNIKVAVFCDVTPSSLVGGYQRFVGTFCLHHEGGRVSLAREKKGQWSREESTRSARVNQWEQSHVNVAIFRNTLSY
jgi:hypothetical protein